MSGINPGVRDAAPTAPWPIGDSDALHYDLGRQQMTDAGNAQAVGFAAIALVALGALYIALIAGGTSLVLVVCAVTAILAGAAAVAMYAVSVRAPQAGQSPEPDGKWDFRHTPSPPSPQGGIDGRRPPFERNPWPPIASELSDRRELNIPRPVPVPVPAPAADLFATSSPFGPPPIMRPPRSAPTPRLAVVLSRTVTENWTVLRADQVQNNTT